MRFSLSRKARRDYEKLTRELQKAADKQLSLLLRDLRHPSLRAKKYDESKNIWQARLDLNWRFYFHIEGDVYYVIAIIKHP
jgi:mRNA-degrading endonuclease RelE of RelBE toxin-antitoxin system